MATTVERKAELSKEYRRHEQDTGSPEIQIALLTDRINSLTEHMKVLKKDQSSRRGLLHMVSQRNRLLRYLSRTNREQYKSVIARLGLRK